MITNWYEWSIYSRGGVPFLPDPCCLECLRWAKTIPAALQCDDSGLGPWSGFASVGGFCPLITMYMYQSASYPYQSVRQYPRAFGIAGVVTGDKVFHLSQAADHDQHRVVALALRQVCDEVHRHVLPGSLGNRQWSQNSLAGLAGSSDPGAGVAVGHPAFNVGEHPGPVVIAGQNLVCTRSLHVSGDRALVVGTDQFGVQFGVVWDIQAVSVVQVSSPVLALYEYNARMAAL